MQMSQLGIAVLRVVVGIVFLAHGAQKLFVHGFGGVTHMFAGMHIPLAHESAILVTLVEFLGGIALILGLGTRWAAILLAIDMAVAIGKVHLRNGFFSSGGGYEYPLTLLAALIALTLAGPGSPALGHFGKRGGRR
jgi:putative oxidoreductase